VNQADQLAIGLGKLRYDLVDAVHGFDSRKRAAASEDGAQHRSENGECTQHAPVPRNYSHSRCDTRNLALYEPQESLVAYPRSQRSAALRQEPEARRTVGGCRPPQPDKLRNSKGYGAFACRPGFRRHGIAVAMVRVRAGRSTRVRRARSCVSAPIAANPSRRARTAPASMSRSSTARGPGQQR
jgi:hypothetical protein